MPDTVSSITLPPQFCAGRRIAERVRSYGWKINADVRQLIDVVKPTSPVDDVSLERLRADASVIARTSERNAGAGARKRDSSIAALIADVALRSVDSSPQTRIPPSFHH